MDWVTCVNKSGVTISDGAVIGMGSVVTHDVGPYEIWAGNPARMIRKRFDDETVENLKQIKWWNWNEEKSKNMPHISQIPMSLCVMWRKNKSEQITNYRRVPSTVSC